MRPLVALAAVVIFTAASPVYPARRICRPGPSVPSQKEKYSVLIVGDSISLGAMGDLTPLLLAGGASVEHAPWSGDGGALDVKYAMDTEVVMTGAGTGPPWVPSVYHPDAVRYGDGCLNGTFLVTATQQPAQYDLISFNYGVHDVDYSGYNEEYVPLALYESNIRSVKKTLQATGAKVVFQASTPVEYNLTTNSRILAYNAAAKKVMAESPTAAYNDLYKTITDICGQPPYNAPSIPRSPNCSISDYNGVHYHAGGWQALANSSASAILGLLAAPPVRRTANHLQPRAAPIQCSTEVSSAEEVTVVSGHDFDEEPWRSGGSPLPTSCPANSTCMTTAYSNTQLGCCLGYGTKAVACKDHVHCCPEGWSCSDHCSLGQCECSPPAA
jgi:hypothetical protein